MASSTDSIYVTFIEVDGNFLKIWGQRNRTSATFIDRQLLHLTEEFNKTPSPDPGSITAGMFCFAKYSEGNYYRARIISNPQGDSIGVFFMDYGNRDLVPLSNIRIQRQNESVLSKMAEQAEEFYQEGIVAPAGGWSKQIVSEIQREICYKELYYQINFRHKFKLIQIKYNNENLSFYLVRKRLAQPISPNMQLQVLGSYLEGIPADYKQSGPSEEAKLFPYSAFPSHKHGRPISSKPVINPPNILHEQNFGKPNYSSNYSHPSNLNQPCLGLMNQMVPDINKPNPNDYHPGASVVSNMPKNRNHMPGIRLPSVSNVCNQYNPTLQNNNKPEQFLNSFNPGMIEALAQQIKQYITEGNAKPGSEEKGPYNYTNTVLEIGSTHNVLISYVDDGPWSFSVQLISSETELNKVVEELSSIELIPIKPPIVLGHPCVGASSVYQSLCRGVIVSISHSAAKVYFVDFGNTEDLPVSSIYELPPKFFKTSVLSQKFCLNGLQKVTYSDEIKMYFKEVVQDELLVLRVCSLEGDNLPTCELYLKDQNIKRILNERITNARLTLTEANPRSGDTENVVVTWVESLQKFYVQLCKRDAELNALKDELALVEANGKPLSYDELHVGLRCICRYAVDGQWYRAVVTSIHTESFIAVVYVDYGNSEAVDISLLRRNVPSGLIASMSDQAIQCCLSGFEYKAFDPEASRKLESLTLEKDLQMSVVSIDKNGLHVKLFTNGEDISNKLVKNPRSDITDRREDFSGYRRHQQPSAFHHKPAEKMKTFESGPDKKGPRTDDSRNKVFAENKHPSNSFSTKKPGSHPPRVSHGRTRERRDENRKPDGEGASQSFRPIVGCKQDKENQSTGEKFPRTEKPGRGKDSKGEPEKKAFKRGKEAEGDKGEGKKSGKKNKDGSSEQRKKGPPPGHDDGNKRACPDTEKDDEDAPKGSTYGKEVVNLGDCEKAIVTYYVSPSEFYVQLLRQEDTFKKMMHEMQTFYSDSNSQKKRKRRFHAAEGDVVVSEFSYDKVLYRAEVIKESPLRVRYVDYGNEEDINAKKIWPLTKRFLAIPRKAVMCRLAGVQPTDAKWPSIGTQVDKFFESEEYNCTFVACENDVFDVRLESADTGRDVASDIIAAGLGAPKRDKLDIPPIDFSLLPTQTLKLNVTHVESPSRFYVVLDPDSAEKLEKEIKGLTEKEESLKLLDLDMLNANDWCLVKENGSDTWLRGTVRSVDPSYISIWCNDRGHTVSAADVGIASLHPSLQSHESQAVECCLCEPSDSISSDDFKAAVEGKNVLVHVVSESEKRLQVALYDQSGRKFDFQKGKRCRDHVESPAELPILVQGIPVVVTHVESPDEIYIRRLVDQTRLELLSRQMTDFYRNATDESGSPGENSLVAVRNDATATWHRARVTSVTGENFELFILDSGRRERTKRENIRKLGDPFRDMSSLTKRVRLDIAGGETAEDINAKLEGLSRVENLLGYFVNDGDVFVEFVLGGARITPTLVSSRKSDKFSELLPEESPEPGWEPEGRETVNGTKVFVIHIESPKEFWVHSESSVNDLQEFQDKLQKACEMCPDKRAVEPGEIVAALFAEIWYRAKVLSVDGTKINLQFIDYGNSLVVDLNAESVKDVPEELQSVPIFAIRHSLGGNWKESAREKFEEIILQYEDPVDAVVLDERYPGVVDLYKDGRSIIQSLIDEGQAEEELPVVYITHYNSPDDFHVQYETSTETLKMLSESLAGAEDFETAVNVQPGEIHAAKFAEDGLWYRAKVLRKSPGEAAEVIFVDFGNASVVSELKVLPVEITEVPEVGKNCCLLTGDRCDEWSEAAAEKFAEFADGRPLRMRTAGRRGGRLVVELFSGDCDVRGELESLSQSDGRIEVHVTHVNSPKDFYMRCVDDEDFEAIKKAAESAEEYAEETETRPGTICFAKTRDDEDSWRRCKILEAASDEGCAEVLLMDVGKTVTGVKFRKAPEEIVALSPTAFRCTLDLPENIPESVKEEFIGLTCDDAVVFRARIISPGNVSVVSLKSDGRILERMLSSLSGNSVIGGTDGRGVSAIVRDDETDDDKNSKKTMAYSVETNVEDDARASTNVLNETDEEKRFKMAAGGADSEGFKSDDEKGITDGLSGLVNATDSDLIEEFQDADASPEERDDQTQPAGETENVEQPAADLINVPEENAETGEEASRNGVAADETEIAGGGEEAPETRSKTSEKIASASVNGTLSTS